MQQGLREQARLRERLSGKVSGLDAQQTSKGDPMKDSSASYIDMTEIETEARLMRAQMARYMLRAAGEWFRGRAHNAHRAKTI